MKIMSQEFLKLQEQRREEESQRRGIEPAPRYTFEQLAIEAIHGINQADPNVIEGSCEEVD